MFWTIFYAGSSVSIFSIWISFPFIFYRIIPLHGRAFLFTDTIIVEIFASLIDREKEENRNIWNIESKVNILTFLSYIRLLICSYQTIWLLWTSASTCAKQMTTFSWLRSKTSSLVTLGTATNLAKLLTVLRARSPASFCTWLMTRGTISFGLMKLVLKSIFGCRTCYNFIFPFNSFDVT